MVFNWGPAKTKPVRTHIVPVASPNQKENVDIFDLTEVEMNDSVEQMQARHV